jgi:hypothetical protein
MTGAPDYVLDAWETAPGEITVYLFGNGWGRQGNGPEKCRLAVLTIATPSGEISAGEIGAGERARIAAVRAQGNRRIAWESVPEKWRREICRIAGAPRVWP